MAVLNFPDPAAQTPADTFSPTSTPAATSNGVTYVWTDGSWSIAGVSSGEFLDKDAADSYYVEQSGDNMTGDLTLGTDKITLGVDGSATFAGEVKAPVFRSANSNTVISETNADKSGSIRLTNGTAANNEYIPLNITANDASKPTFRVTQFGENSKLEMGGSGATADITLNSNDGSATFAGSVGAGNTTLNVAGFDLNISDGTNNVAQYSAGSGLFIGNAGSNNLIGNSAIQLNENGSATFTDTAAGGGEIYLARAGYAIDVWSGGARTYGITFGGSAGFRELSLDLEPENDANYVTTTDVDEEGNTVETRIYNGPTLDVKAVIQDLQQRVNDRDAVIANLTTRIQALEGGNN